MSVVTIVEYITDGRIYEGLPQGIEPWYARAMATGDASGGDQGLSINFNPGAPNTFQPYVSVCGIGIINTNPSVDFTDEFVAVLHGDDWEKSINVPPNNVGSLPFATLALTDNNYGQGAVWNEVFYCGRVASGRDGTMSIRASIANGAISNIFVSGFIADRPFITHNDWRV
jgi:hypothetical protein